MPSSRSISAASSKSDAFCAVGMSGTQGIDTTHLKVFVGGLSPTHTSKDLYHIFSVYGPIREAVVVGDRAGVHSQGYGFVTFVSQCSVSHVFKKAPNKLTVKLASSSNKRAHSNHGNILPIVMEAKPKMRKRKRCVANTNASIPTLHVHGKHPTKQQQYASSSSSAQYAIASRSNSSKRRIMYIAFDRNARYQKAGYADEQSVEAELRGKFAVYSTDRLESPTVLKEDEIVTPHGDGTLRVVMVPARSFRCKTVVVIKVDRHLTYHCYYDKKTKIANIFTLGTKEPSIKVFDAHNGFAMAIQSVCRRSRQSHRITSYTMATKIFTIPIAHSLLTRRIEKTQRKENTFD